MAKTNHFNVTIFEKENQLGGLSSYYQWQDVICDRFYHVILPTDTHMIEFMKELNLESELFWQETKIGFCGKGKLVSFSSIIDFIRFPFLSFWQKFRLGLGIFRSARIREPSKLDKIYAHQWLIKVFGQKVYENIWEPLLRSKLGDAKDRTSASFIWATIIRLYGARSSWNKREKMGYVHGGYHTVLNAAQRKLSELNVKTVTNVPALSLDSIQDGEHIILATSSGSIKFDKLLFTIPFPEVLKVVNKGDNHPSWRQLQHVEYLGVICVLLILSRKLSPFYVINLLDKELPFTGIIETTNIISPQVLGEKHLIYLPKYLRSDDPMNGIADDKIIKLFVEKLKSVFPDLKDEEILHKKIFREKYVQPLHELNSFDYTTDFKTPSPNIFLANTSRMYNTTLNNNAAINLAREAARTIISDSKKE